MATSSRLFLGVESSVLGRPWRDRLDLAAQGRAEALAQVGLRLRFPADERVDHHLAAPDLQLHQEMTGEGHAMNVESQAPADLHVQDGQRDRNAGVAVDHFVEVAVARIVVIVHIT